MKEMVIFKTKQEKHTDKTIGVFDFWDQNEKISIS